LRAAGCDVRLLVPAFPAFTGNARNLRVVASLPSGATAWGHAPSLPTACVVSGTLAGQGDTAYLLQAPSLFDRAGDPYQAPDGPPWSDNALRFTALSWAAAALGTGLDPAWVPDIVHCHDWHTGLTPAFITALAQSGQAVPATVFSIHNLAYQGLFPHGSFLQTGLPESFFSITGLEYYGQMSFMKAGIRFAQRITTVSPTYAREILTPDHGCGLDGLLRQRADDVTGILNGVDGDIWNPATDKQLPVNYDTSSLANKAAVKRALQISLGLEPRSDALVFGIVSRLTEQKGLHLVPQIIADLLHHGGQLALLGKGDAALERAFEALAREYPSQVGVRIGYDEASAHLVVAGCDVIMVPSAFEPCGLTQLYGLRYGTLPLVRRVGGLADTVVDCTLENLDAHCATGFVFDTFSAQGLHSAVQRAFALKRRPQEWLAVQQRGMALRFDWAQAARHYVDLYQSVRPDVVSGAKPL